MVCLRIATKVFAGWYRLWWLDYSETKLESTLDVLKMLNLLVRFLLELCMLAMVGYWRFKTQSGWTMKILLGIGLPVLIAVLWGLFLAPRAAYPLRDASYLTLELILFASGAVALFASGKPTLGWAYTIILMINKILLVLWKQ